MKTIIDLGSELLFDRLRIESPYIRLPSSSYGNTAPVVAIALAMAMPV
jgi:hypothetical protein